jgi:hypothetical protein
VDDIVTILVSEQSTAIGHRRYQDRAQLEGQIR